MKLYPVCPALAGMSPPRADMPANVAGLPRTRGDEPLELTRANKQARSAPHSRG